MAFTLASIMTENDAPPPERIVVYGVEGVGKTSFGANAPKPIFVQTEDGLRAFRSTPKFPLCRTYGEVMDAFRVLAEEEHDYETVVLDSADWLEHLIMDQVARDVGIDKYNSNHKDLAFGRGNRAIADYWRAVLDTLDYLNSERGMRVIILAHSKVQRYDDPTTDAYDRYQLDLTKESSALISEWCDVLAFANYQISVKEETVGINGKKKRGLSSGDRFLFTQERPAYKAKARWAIPDKLPLDYAAFANAIAAAQAQPLPF
jgi:AAA domain